MVIFLGGPFNVTTYKTIDLCKIVKKCFFKVPIESPNTNHPKKRWLLFGLLGWLKHWETLVQNFNLKLVFVWLYNGPEYGGQIMVIGRLLFKFMIVLSWTLGGYFLQLYFG